MAATAWEMTSRDNPDIAAGHIDDLDRALRHLRKSRFIGTVFNGDY